MVGFFEVIVFYFINNIYFGLQFENYRLLQCSEKNIYFLKHEDGSVEKLKGKAARKNQKLGFLVSLSALFKQLFSLGKSNNAEEIPNEGENIIKESK